MITPEDFESVITIRSVYKTTRAELEPAKNPLTHRYPDCVKQVDSNGDLILTHEERQKDINLFVAINEATEIFDGKTFNLQDPYERVRWEAIKYSKIIAKDRDERDERGNLVIDGDAKKYGVAEFYVERLNYITKTKNTKKRLVHKAKEFIYGDNERSLANRALILGHDMSGRTVYDIEEFLIDIAEKKPQDIIDAYTGSDSNLLLLFIDAQKKGIIRKERGVFVYGDDIFLGSTKDMVINYFKDPGHASIFNQIKVETAPEFFPNADTSSFKRTKDETIMSANIDPSAARVPSEADMPAEDALAALKGAKGGKR